MEPAMIMVLVLCAGVLALLVWFEVNSRRNEASKTAQSAGLEMLPKESQTTVEPKGDKKKAA
jgi:hypothetical protein